MRDYLYIWNDPHTQCVLASGIEFRAIADSVGTDGGIVTPFYDACWLNHGEIDEHSHLSYIPRPYVVSELAAEDLYDLGDFCWVDYVGTTFPRVPDDELAELLFFAHLGRPLSRIRMPSLQNRFLGHVHDDGWRLKLYYASWSDVEALLTPRYRELDLDDLRAGTRAYWLEGGIVEIEELTQDVDLVINRRL